MASTPDLKDGYAVDSCSTTKSSYGKSEPNETLGHDDRHGIPLLRISGLAMQDASPDDFVSSLVGVGTNFALLLPTSAEKPDMSTSTAMTSTDRGSGTVLTVEDKDAVRNLFCNTLHDAGYSVLKAASGKIALRLVDDRVRR